MPGREGRRGGHELGGVRRLLEEFSLRRARLRLHELIQSETERRDWRLQIVRRARDVHLLVPASSSDVLSEILANVFAGRFSGRARGGSGSGPGRGRGGVYTLPL